MHQRVRRVSTYPIPWLLAILGLAPIAAAEGPAAAIPETQSGVARPRAELEMQGLFEAITPLAFPTHAIVAGFARSARAHIFGVKGAWVESEQLAAKMQLDLGWKKFRLA